MLTALSTLKCRLQNRLPLTRQGLSRFTDNGLNRSFALAREIIERSDRLQHRSDAELMIDSRSLQQQASTGADLHSLLPAAFALVREAARRTHGQSHYDVQLVTGIRLFEDHIVEMQTGEGKTLAALLPAYLRAIVGKGCHVVTANDYLAQRDAEFASLTFDRLGITVGCLFDGLRREHRRGVYAQDITYGTAREFGFDFLKDRLADTQAIGNRTPQSVNNLNGVQRGHFFALVDEADSVLIDDARTPLLIAGKRPECETQQALFRACQRIARKLTADQDFQLDFERRSATLTQHGCSQTLRHAQVELAAGVATKELFRQIENSLAAVYLFQLDRDYVIADQTISIVDESSGRVADGRQWQDGLHQAIEAKEEVPISSGTETLARITIQSYFRRYQHLSGLTGTAESAAKEFKRVYKLPVTIVPTRNPSQRIELPQRIFARYVDKAIAIAIETSQRVQTGQPVLIGTPSVQASIKISKVLNEFEIDHCVLNCIEHERESAIVAKAGQSGRVTVATNMAGRGTDIGLDPDVLRCGGLHVIITETHSSSRIDRQLVGRCGRQGQPGSFQFFLSMEDELFSLAGETDHVRKSSQQGGELNKNWLKHFQLAQSKLERLHAHQRLNLMQREQQRQKVCQQIGLDGCLEMLDE